MASFLNSLLVDGLTFPMWLFSKLPLVGNITNWETFIPRVKRVAKRNLNSQVSCFNYFIIALYVLWRFMDHIYAEIQSTGWMLQIFVTRDPTSEEVSSKQREIWQKHRDELLEEQKCRIQNLLEEREETQEEIEAMCGKLEYLEKILVILHENNKVLIKALKKVAQEELRSSLMHERYNVMITEIQKRIENVLGRCRQNKSMTERDFSYLEEILRIVDLFKSLSSFNREGMYQEASCQTFRNDLFDDAHDSTFTRISSFCSGNCDGYFEDDIYYGLPVPKPEEAS